MSTVEKNCEKVYSSNISYIRRIIFKGHKTQTDHQTFPLLGTTFVSQLNIDFTSFNLSQTDAVEARRGKFVSHSLEDSSL